MLHAHFQKGLTKSVLISFSLSIKFAWPTSKDVTPIKNNHFLAHKASLAFSRVTHENEIVWTADLLTSKDSARLL